MFNKIASGCQWSALEVGSARPLAIPTQTRLAAASPFHGCLVSPGSREAIYCCLPNHVDNWSFAYAGKSFRDGCHRGLRYFPPMLTGRFPGLKTPPRPH